MDRLIDNLKELYGDAIVTADSSNDRIDWYITSDNKTFGIKHNTLSDKENQLFKALVQSATPKSKPSEATLSYFWQTFLEQNKPESREAVLASARKSEAHVLFLSFAKPLENPNTLEELIGVFANAPCTLVQQDPRHAYVVVEGIIDTDYKDFVDIAASDLFVTIKIMVTPAAKIQELPEFFSPGKLLFEEALIYYPNQQFFQYHELLILGLIAFTDSEIRDRLFTPFQDVVTGLDEETIKTLLIFFDHHLNVTNASKALFIHRNSLQYRLDKFQERFGLDPKSFNDAVLIRVLLEVKRFLKHGHPAQ